MIKNIFNKSIFLSLLWTLVCTTLMFKTHAQVRVDFNPRSSVKAPAPYTNVKNYNLQGDFTMIGNTNLTLLDYSDGGGNENHMIYVDVDNVASTFNSSSAELQIPGGECSEVVYAGLYWTGRAHDIDKVSSSPTVFDITVKEWMEGSNINTTQTVTSEGLVPSSSYSMTKERAGTSGNYYTRFTLNSPRTGLTYTIDFRDDAIYIFDPSINDWVAHTYYTQSVSSNKRTGVLNDPFVIQDGNLTLTITELAREHRGNRSESSYTGSRNSITFEMQGPKVSSIDVTRQVDKRKVKLRVNNEPYIDVTALDTDIHYPTTSDGAMYAAYADVTDYVRQHGVGNYFVADMALQEGKGGGTGYYGGWGMVVVYKNTSFKWRDITVFDGYAYMKSQGGSQELPVDGFRATQNGDVNVKIGMMAGEGDVGIDGDYFQIRNATNTNWVSLSHGGNTTNNFFNSSIYTGGNPRNPNLNNNTGVDVSMFELDNTDKSLITNNQTSTRFRYGTNRDTYIIFNIVFAVDAYVPEVVGENNATNFGGAAPTHNGTISPGQEFEFELDVLNKGTEAVNNTKIEIPIPFNLHFTGADVIPGLPAGGTVTWIPPVGGTIDPLVTSGGKIVWNIGNLPLDADKEKLLAQLKYRFKVSDNCLLLSTNVCGLEVKINGKISGTGAISNTGVSSDLVRDYGDGVCAGPVYDDFMSTITLSADFLQSCNPPVEDGVMQFKAFCEVPVGGYPRAEIMGEYPEGTKFFNVEPASYSSSEGVITGDFPVNADDSKTLYYVVAPGMEDGCYAKLEISVETVTTSPTAENVVVCFGEDVELLNELSQTGVDRQYDLVYFDSDDNQLTEAPNPTAVGEHTYYVAEGKDGCFGPKVEFTITINALPEVAKDISNIEVCENFDSKNITVNTDAATMTWEYLNVGVSDWSEWTANSLSGVTIEQNSIQIHHAPNTLNGVKFRMRVSNGSCSDVSNEFEVIVKDCAAVTNPMLLNQAGK